MADKSFIQPVEDDLAEAKHLHEGEKEDILRITKEIDAIEEAAPPESGEE